MAIEDQKLQEEEISVMQRRLEVLHDEGNQRRRWEDEEVCERGGNGGGAGVNL